MEPLQNLIIGSGKESKYPFFLRHAVAFVFFCFHGLLAAPQNLLPNPGFEKNIGGKVSEWLQPSPGLNWYHYESHTINDNGKITFNSYNGLCLIHPQGSEYLAVRLKSKLVRGQLYCAKMQVLLSSNKVYNLGSIEWMFVPTRPEVRTWVKIYGKPDIQFSLEAEHDRQGFEIMRNEYTARGDEEFLIIGKFFSHEEDSLMSSIMATKMLMIRERDSIVRAVNDTFSRHYPAIPDYNKKKTRKKDINDFQIAVQMVEEEKEATIKVVLNQYKIGLDSLELLLAPHNYFVRVYFDNICLAVLDNLKACNCEDVTEAVVGGFIKGNTYRFNELGFKPGEAILDSMAKVELDVLVKLLKAHRETRVNIIGHTDDTNTPSFNLKLSKDRAKACVNYLVSKGINEKILSWEGFGADKPLADNKSEEGRRMNRRVEFVIW
jgi:outer membrane protein OmpA-like peptidoglycan-associated protein